ncbi:MAG: CehA/McbA family metallohydrolase [Prosthecobacter sp.]|uniref:CehA/McbA family metallohydrolase n=1 Tax=Prosthecobacter sp. TaxID=1965333 RepID=UPI0025E5E920|nr:CehA/McbA family metallohydrolase [Prosthecobacter sp.]MCF7788119.1 CehA/McbA family metallohydrolase [Prosthecobacter sp.]
MKSAILLSLLIAISVPAAEVFEAALGRETELPQGKEADGIMGDFVLRSDKVEAVISQNSPGRKANMSTFYGEDGVTPGCLYDLSLRGANNDQLVVYAPCGHGPVSYVKILASKEKNEAAVESVTTAAKNSGVFKRHEYRVKDGVQGIFITTTLRNETDKSQKTFTKSDFTRFDSTGMSSDGIFWADAINPAHKCGYAVSTLNLTGIEKLEDILELKPGQEVVISRFFAVGTSPAQAVGEFRSVKGVKLGTMNGLVLDRTGKGIATAKVLVADGEKNIAAYPDDEGKFSIKLPQGTVDLKIEDLGRNSSARTATVVAGAVHDPKVVLTDAARIRFDITDESGKPIPCKAHFAPLDHDAPKLDFGPKWRAHGCVDQYMSENGQFTQQLPPGKYRVVVVRGPEYSHLEQEVTVEPGKESVFKGTLKRLVDTKGWISADFHNHSTPSGDNVCDIDGRLINIAAENLEFTPTTEHNRFYDWEPTIKALGLEAHIKTVKGVELTGSRQHLNAFPFEPDPLKQNGGAPDWNDDPRITVLTLRRWQGERADRWIQFNHPDLSNMFVDRDNDGIKDGGFVGVGSMIDGTESQNGASTDILADAPFRLSRPAGSLAMKVTAVREFVWRQLLNQGLRVTAVGVADAHSVYGNGVGCWRCYLPSSTDEPAKIDWAELAPHSKAGHLVLSTGPFLEVTTQNGKIAGDDDRSTGGIDLKVRVQCTDWMDIDRVQVLVNSRPDPKLNFTRATHPQMFKDGVVKFDEKIHIPLQHDAHLIVVAIDEDGDEKTCYGTSDYAKIRPCAYNNPIYVDADGNGFKPNYDTLDFDLPAGGLKVDAAKEKLMKAGLIKEGPQPAAPTPAPAPTAEPKKKKKKS